MSDNAIDILRDYDQNVHLKEYARSIGLFPIPEYPEDESRGMWSTAIAAILTALRYIAPATLLTIFWGQQSFLFKLLRHIYSAFRAIVFSSEKQKQGVLKWLEEAGPVRIEHLDTVWRHGWILCGILDSALPGACAGHSPTRLSLKHAQTIADHYLGVEPVFSRQELESCDSLSKHQEWKLATYLDRIRLALSKLTPPVSKPTSQRTSPENSQFTFDYVARGSGLAAAQVNNRIHFKIFPTTQQMLDPGDINILIRGPKDTYGMAVVPPILGKVQTIRQKLLGLQLKTNFTENILPTTQGATYLRSYGKNDMNKTFHIPKKVYDIDIDVDVQADHVKLGYIVNLEGKHEISITSRGQNIVGSPFTVTATKNILKVFERDSFCLEDGEEIDIVDVKTDRKVVLRIVDFVTEKMLLNENGTLETISDDEAKALMSSDFDDHYLQDTKKAIITNKYAFKTYVNKIVKMNRTCKVFKEIITKRNKLKTEKAYNRPRSQQDIPDIVNSTLFETNKISYINPNKKGKLIIPENISVSIKQEKSACTKLSENIVQQRKTHIETSEPDKIIETENYIISEGIKSATNPFLCDVNIQNYNQEKTLGTFVNTEYETNNSQNEETQDTPIKILIEPIETPSPSNSNPFIDPDILLLERPKTPILKIITGEASAREDFGYLDPTTKKITEEILGNEFINPFFMHQQHQSSQDDERVSVTDFIIGAPVTLQPSIRAPSIEHDMESIMFTAEGIMKDDKTDESTPSTYSTPVHINLKNDNKKLYESNISSTFHSLDSTIEENNENFNVSCSARPFQRPIETVEKIVSKRDLWDSAYVSIDETNTSPDSNNNDNIIYDCFGKQMTAGDESYELQAAEISKMGPAEREIWEACNILHTSSVYEEEKSNKREPKRLFFTPIIEENDRSISSAMKDFPRPPTSMRNTETDLVTTAISESEDEYDLNNSGRSSTSMFNDNRKTIHNVEVEYAVERNKMSVDSASETIADVKRHVKELEGEISGVQANVTESVSVSHNLHDNKNENLNQFKTDNTQFGDRKQPNIVIEKKKYWDNKIREIEAKKEEDQTQQIIRNSLKHLRQKEIAKTIPKSTPVNSSSPIEEDKSIQSLQESDEPCETNVKLVEKWKKFWDDKLDSEKDELDTTSSMTKSPKNTSKEGYKQSSTDTYNQCDSPSLLPVKQELPEEVFKAFETSPKRFFGTSRKQILNKIDTFLGKPCTADKIATDDSGVIRDSNLVASRISLFHSISQSEETPIGKRKCQSMHNIYHRRDSEKSSPTENHSETATPKKVTETKQDSSVERKNNQVNIKNQNERESNISSIKSKRSKLLQNVHNKTFDETVYEPQYQKDIPVIKPVKKVIQDLNNLYQHHPNSTVLRKSSVSKSEMDIFSKTTSVQNTDKFEIHKSCDELPKINVKNVISLYEGVSKSAKESSPVKSFHSSSSSISSYKFLRTSSLSSETAGKLNGATSDKNIISKIEREGTDVPTPPPRRKRWTNESMENISNDIIVTTNPVKSEVIKSTEEAYISLSDIELEIIESSPDRSEKSTPEREIDSDYKSRFKTAKQYFQSLEELREENKNLKLNECELLLQGKSEETLDIPQKRVKKYVKSNSVPSSEISKAWKEMNDAENETTKLVKISEKFDVDDLFNDVMEGKLSRQGSLRGIPHKQAVLDTFRSMENISDTKFCPYVIAVTQLNDFAKENKISNAQTYLTEYPYLPTTDPSKYHSRLDAKASGLISLRELLNNKRRRNSVPDLRLNSKFTVDL